MKIKEQTRKLAAGCSKHCFEVVDKTDEVSYIYLRQGEADVVFLFSKSMKIKIPHFVGLQGVVVFYLLDQVLFIKRSRIG